MQFTNKLYLISFALVLFHSEASSQLASIDSAINFSYKIQGGKLKEKQINNAGTGFLLIHRNKIFLISNYHVFTGKDAYSNKKMGNLKDTNDAIILLIPYNNDTGFYRVIFPLYDLNNNRLFSIFHANKDTLIDIAVYQIDQSAFKGDLHLYALNDQCLDLVNVYKNDLAVINCGFPGGKMIDKWKPTIKKSKSIYPINNDNSVIPYLYFTDSTFQGMSGGPTYLQNEKTGLYYLAAVNSINPNSDPLNHKIKGGGILMWYVIQLLDEMIKQNNPSIDLYYR